MKTLNGKLIFNSMFDQERIASLPQSQRPFSSSCLTSGTVTFPSDACCITPAGEAFSPQPSLPKGVIWLPYDYIRDLQSAASDGRTKLRLLLLGRYVEEKGRDHMSTKTSRTSGLLRSECALQFTERIVTCRAQECIACISLFRLIIST